MDSINISQRENHPRKLASPLSVISFSWLIPLFLKGWKEDLDLEDLYKPLKDHSSNFLGEKLESLWKEHVLLCKIKNQNPRLLKVIWRMFGTSIILQGVLVFFVELILRLAQPFLLGGLIDSFSGSGSLTSMQTQLYAGGLIACIFFTSLLLHTYHMNVVHIGMKIRVAISSLIYRKVLRLNFSRDENMSTGKIVTLLSNDAMRFDYAITFLHDLWIGPLQVIVVYYFLWELIGYSSFVGLVPVIIFIHLHFCFGKTISNLRRKTVLKTDERINYASEVIKGINVIKMHALESLVSDFISLLRRKEINVFKKLSYVRGIMNSFPMFHTRLTTTLTILTYVLLGNFITSKKVFVLTSYLNILQASVATYFPEGISQMSEFFVSIKRIEEYLLSDEKSKEVGTYKPQIIESSNDKLFTNLIPHIRMVDVCAKWDSTQSENVLDGINMYLTPGKVYLLTGAVGAGKTAVFQAILGEIIITSGVIDIEGEISYTSQEPWIFPGSVRQNILFGSVFEKSKYNKVLRACALDMDLESLPLGDLTEIGGKGGIALSTGQKARINLARSVYKEASIYLLDDPLSAVDLNVGIFLYRHCIKGLLKDNVVILISHQLQYVDNDDNVILLENGKVKFQGPKWELEDLHLGFTKNSDSNVQNEQKNYPQERAESIKSSTSTMDRGNVGLSKNKNKNNLSLYQSYLKSGYGRCMLFVTIIMFTLPQVFGSFGDFWLSFWVNLEENHYFLNSTIKYDGGIPKPSRELCIIIFGSLVAATALASFIRSLIYYCACMKASLNLHDQMFKSVTRATINFFNETSAGSILTRFSKDFGIIDEQLPSALHDFLQISLMAVGIIVVVPTTDPWLLIPSAIAFFIFYLLRIIYISTSNNLRSLEGSTRSPIITHLTATLQGLITVRSSKVEKILTKEFDGHQDIHSSTWYVYLAINRGFALWLDLICVLYNAVITLIFVYIDKSASGANVGLAITQANGLTGILQWGVRQSAEVDNNMVSVKRILDYTNLEQEPPLRSTGVQVLAGWPQRGSIEFTNVSIRYGIHGPWVLKNINVSISPCQKVGIVGRTGAGKTSLIAALFRLADIEGMIKIDGVDTSLLGLHDFRSKITVITQEPFLFSGPLRKSLDPYDIYPDERLWAALEEVQLKEFVKDLTGGLNTQITEGGSNVSVGQRQLICLARAILNENKIVVLDESTSNIDYKTEALIQKTLKTKFSDCTVLTIAHRILTVMDSDLIIVMDSGTIVEMGHPLILLQNDEGFLYKLTEGNKELAEKMFNMAKKNYEENLVPMHDCTS
ncbi:ATP-binding cassette sub-family C member 4-like isoform X2 [Rhodnius prolixus]|uniref:ATP-binding cassette sub-family C member 4-like isoform X2 n=1 Tax=Rhodnius prolixus TaxID=13249 RepID=UPI003D1892A4